MKTIPLKKVQMKRPDGVDMTLSYWVQLQTTMRTPMDVQQGANVDEIRKSIRILDALDKAGEDAEFFELEDTDFEYMADKVKASRFTFADPAIVQFVDDVTDVEDDAL